MLPYKKHVFITEPSWFEKPIPNWVNQDEHSIISDTDCVILEAHRKKIDCVPLKQFVSAKDLYTIEKEELENERKIIASAKESLEYFSHSSGLLQGLSLFTSSAKIISLALTKILDNHVVSEIVLIKGSRFQAMPFETPRGGFLIHYLLIRLCKLQNIKYSLANHQIESFRECQNSNRYDKSFNLIQESNPKPFSMISSNQNTLPVLFLYCYEMCKEDLEPLKSSYGDVYKGVISEWAPQNQDYHFNFLNPNNKKNNILLSSYKAIIHVLKNTIEHSLIKYNFLESQHLKKIMLKLTSSYMEQLKSSDAVIKNILQTVEENNIHTICMTGFPSSLQSMIAQFFTNKGVTVKLRQHGALTHHLFHEHCFVEGTTYILNSSNIKLPSYPRQKGKLEYLPRYKTVFYKSTSEVQNKSVLKKILISDDLYFTSAEYKLENLLFLEKFLSMAPSNFQITFRSHPRYGAASFTKSSASNFTIEDSNSISAGESLSTASICIIPHQKISSLICDSINLRVPVVLFIPDSTYKQYSFDVNMWNFPMIVSNPTQLIKLILSIESNNSEKNKVLKAQQDWLDLWLGKSKPIYVNDKFISKDMKHMNLTRYAYFKIIVRTLFTNLFNTFKL
jgi:hypothetical protein